MVTKSIAPPACSFGRTLLSNGWETVTTTQVSAPTIGGAIEPPLVEDVGRQGGSGSMSSVGPCFEVVRALMGTNPNETW